VGPDFFELGDHDSFVIRLVNDLKAVHISATVTLRLLLFGPLSHLFRRDEVNPEGFPVPLVGPNSIVEDRSNS
jgi:hypothetical protein